MWVTENGFHRGSAIEMSSEGWAGFYQVNDAEESLENLHEYPFVVVVVVVTRLVQLTGNGYQSTI